ncbi:Gfo/Idh/MocA family protein [Pseudactinotalea sp. Z1748]|uniref:Gfo/Idh/MocA family protein n=1 Tax=Pseudactinotalea sp. Z1748 TaxID=3413027 RepID=UPI003C7DAF35
MSDRPLGVGIVGVGGIAPNHIAALRSTPLAALRAVCDVDLSRATQLGRAEDCAAYGDLAEMLTDDDVEAVVVCTPNVSHAALGQQVLDAGRHLLMEKPLAMNAQDARNLAATAQQEGLALAVGHSHRFSDQGRAIRETIESGAIGTPRFVRIVINGGWIWPGWQSWILNPEVSGGHSLHNGVHLTDLATWWIGEHADSVFAVGQHATSAALEIYDYLVVELGFPSGASAICEISRGERPRTSNFLEMTVVGSEGVLAREWDAQGLLAWGDTGLHTWAPHGEGARTFHREMESFANAARGRAPVIPSIDEAVHAVDVAVAAEQSLAEGRPIAIAEASIKQSGAV